MVPNWRSLKVEPLTYYNLWDEQRKFLWGLEDKSWELLCAVYGESEPQPQPLLAFEEGLQLDKWVSQVADYSDAWHAGFLAYKSLSLSKQERIELMVKMNALPGLKYVISLKDLKPGQWVPEWKWTHCGLPGLNSVKARGDWEWSGPRSCNRWFQTFFFFRELAKLCLLWWS